ncbi:ROK family protein [Microbacterium sp. zg.Y1090]|uniref:ROK family protein n=1 Tax=Microbacterium wangruii TaxID=3049073 RepID=UPI00214DE101|nr:MULTISPECIES: ROK family protein [unclassified Microbacterium]MCR2819006.1 ROK family protein [Microbacterium sp. zg.Y1090]MDL5487656.1 ROK family protein [Microbacterium sp. zg-Y1211]WIM27311.1 ROK family protein [Microbacterium sp. zg-Y1090]
MSADASSRVVAGVDIGGTKTAGALVAADGTVLARASRETPARDGGAAMAETAARVVEELYGRAGVRADAVGVGAAGVVEHDTGTIRAASATFVGWTGFPLGERLAERLSLPVQVENDVNAFLLGETAWGAARGSDVLGVMLGTGVGGALVMDGRLRHGPHGAAGEIGHTPGYGELRCTCGRTGHLETLASGTSIARRYAEATDRPLEPARIVAQRARGGDPAARAVFADAGQAVALACVSAATLVDLPLVVVGGGVVEAWDLLAPAVQATLASDPPVSGVPLRIVPGTLRADAVVLGAAALVAHPVSVPPAESEPRRDDAS